MEKLIEAMQKDMELAKIVFGEDKNAAYEAANAIEPCDKAQFEEFYNENRAKSSAIAKVLQKAASDEEFAKIIYGEDRKAAYEAAQTVSSGYTADEFENVCKILVAVALKVSNKDDELLSDEELDQVAGGGVLWGIAKIAGGFIGAAILSPGASLFGGGLLLGASVALVTSGVREIKKGVKDSGFLMSVAMDVAEGKARVDSVVESYKEIRDWRKKFDQKPIEID